MVWSSHCTGGWQRHSSGVPAALVMSWHVCAGSLHGPLHVGVGVNSQGVGWHRQPVAPVGSAAQYGAVAGHGPVQFGYGDCSQAIGSQ